MATIKLVIKKSFVKNSGKTPIYIQCIFKSINKVTINTGIEVFPDHWNPVTQSIKERADNYYEDSYASLNALLSEKVADFKEFIALMISKGHLLNSKLVKDHYFQFLKNRQLNVKPVPKRLISIYDHLADYINRKESNDSVKCDTLKDYRSLVKHLRQFEQFTGRKISFDTIDYSFYEEFIHFLFYETCKPNNKKGLLTNSVGKQIKNLKAFLRDRIRLKYCAEIDLSGFTTLTEEVDKIYLTRKELSHLYRFDLTNNEHLSSTRDMLILGCLIGLRFSDLSRINPDMIIDGFLEIRQKKVRRKVRIPILNEAEKILNKYYLHSPNLTMAEFNRNVKELGKLVGIDTLFEVTHYKKGLEFTTWYKKFELLSSHVCRRSFCTNEYLEGTDVQLIMKISGHRTYKAFMTYLKIDETVASTRIADVWKMRTSL